MNEKQKSTSGPASSKLSGVGSVIIEAVDSLNSDDVEGIEVNEIIFGIAWTDNSTGEMRLTVGASGNASMAARQYMASEIVSAFQ